MKGGANRVHSISLCSPGRLDDKDVGGSTVRYAKSSGISMRLMMFIHCWKPPLLQAKQPWVPLDPLHQARLHCYQGPVYLVRLTVSTATGGKC